MGHQTNHRGCCYLHARAHARKSDCKHEGGAGLADHARTSRPIPTALLLIQENIFFTFIWFVARAAIPLFIYLFIYLAASFNSLKNMHMDKTSIQKHNNLLREDR